MRKQLTIMLAGLLSFGLAACAQTGKKKENKSMENKKTTLVAYFSATGTTAEAAKQLAKAANADIYEIEPEQKYTDADLDWTNKQARSTVEMKDAKSRPAIKGTVPNIGQYDTVYVGFPIWWYTAPTIINTFVEKNNLRGKTLITFATSGGSSVAKATHDLQKAYPELKWKEGSLLNSRSPSEAQKLVEKFK